VALYVLHEGPDREKSRFAHGVGEASFVYDVQQLILLGIRMLPQSRSYLLNPVAAVALIAVDRSTRVVQVRTVRRVDDIQLQCPEALQRSQVV